MAAKHLLEQLRAASGDQSVFLRATALEIYNDEVYDLLGPEKLPCSLRVDSLGRLQVTGPPAQYDLAPEEKGILQGAKTEAMHATIVTRSSGLRAMSVCQPADLEGLTQGCVQKRAVGSSTEHEQSSRSHAIMRLEVVNDAVLDARAAVEEAAA